MADLIAAGEVVERPASVAKELIENAIDAGAKHITVEMENGGISFLRITDDGCGMSAEDAPVAFRRHATSKLHNEYDLAAIETLGFRGEALAAIASVSKIDLLTKQKDDLAGTHLHLEAGKILEQQEAGCPEGTTIIIRQIFYNTPARMKFLKKDATEAGYITSTVQHAALSHPEISFTCLRDGKRVFSTAGDGRLITPIFSVLGKDLTAEMLQVDELVREHLCVWGYISKAHSPQATRNRQYFFVNGRYVKNRTMQAAVEEAYRNKIITGKYPYCALFLTLPFHAVDVNVHPAKTEIKFSNEKSVFDIVYAACKNKLDADDNIPQITVKQPKPEIIPDKQAEIPAKLPAKEPMPIQREASKAYLPLIECDDFEDQEPIQLCQGAPVMTLPDIAVMDIHDIRDIRDTADSIENPEPELAPEPEKAASIPDFQVLGQAFKTYIVAQDDDGLFLIDKHAAHERMIFNKLRESTEIPQQQLLSPAVIEFAPVEAACIAEHIQQVQQAGFDITPFGGDAFAVRSMPAYLDFADLREVLMEIAEKLHDSREAQTDKLDDLIHTVSCKAAIKAGSQTSMQEMREICTRVLSDPEVTCCPHGRPVMIRLTKYELDKLFKRVNQ